MENLTNNIVRERKSSAGLNTHFRGPVDKIKNISFLKKGDGNGK